MHVTLFSSHVDDATWYVHRSNKQDRNARLLFSGHMYRNTGVDGDAKKTCISSKDPTLNAMIGVRWQAGSEILAQPTVYCNNRADKESIFQQHTP